ncbi:MAG: hypothetical protein AAGA40_16885 [Cyanobacteria bacterium P01_E01_bin.45]
MFVISVDEALELQLTSVTQGFGQPVNGIRYARHLWKEVVAGCSFERACEVARKYFESPPDADALPLVVEKSSGFSLYLSDRSLRESNAAKASLHSRNNKIPQATFRGRPIARSVVACDSSSARSELCRGQSLS